MNALKSFFNEDLSSHNGFDIATVTLIDNESQLQLV